MKFTNTLLVDGNALFKTGFFGAKDEYNHLGQHIGGLYQFLTVLRKLLNEDLYHKVLVFWDGKFSGKLRYEIYSPYKSARGKDYINGTQTIDESERKQKERIMIYLEELGIRQLQHDVVESDDMIAYYCKTKEQNEKVTICTNDRDMCQLIKDNIRIYFCDLKNYIDFTNYKTYFHHHQNNAALIKTIIGDNSDSIKGIKGVKETTLLSHFPEIAERKVTLDEVLQKAREIQQNRQEKKLKPLKVLDNLLNAITDGIQGNMIYEINSSLVDLSQPKMTADAIEKLEFLRNGIIDYENRGIKNVLTLMRKDGLDFTIGRERYGEYLLPFKKYMERDIRNQEN